MTTQKINIPGSLPGRIMIAAAACVFLAFPARGHEIAAVNVDCPPFAGGSAPTDEASDDNACGAAASLEGREGIQAQNRPAQSGFCTSYIKKTLLPGKHAAGGRFAGSDDVTSAEACRRY